MLYRRNIIVRSAKGAIYIAPSTCTCASGSYYSNNQDMCIACHPFCTSCNGMTNKDCLPNKCSTNAFPVSGQLTTCLYSCVSSIDHYYLEQSSNNCKGILFLIVMRELTNHFVECSIACKSCDITATRCIACYSPLVLYNSSCIFSCPAGYYNDEERICLPCNNGCFSCKLDPNYCLTGCYRPYIFKDNACVKDCGSGYMSVKRTCAECSDEHTGDYCEPCPPNCLECYKGEQINGICTKCDKSTFLWLGECKFSCPLGTFGTDKNECSKCDDACTDCFGADKRSCYSCNETLGYIKYVPNICALPSCGTGTYYNYTTKTCEYCSSVCKECITFSQCSSCYKGLQLNYATKKCYDLCDRTGFKRDPNTLECNGTVFIH